MPGRSATHSRPLWSHLWKTVFLGVHRARAGCRTGSLSAPAMALLMSASSTPFDGSTWSHLATFWNTWSLLVTPGYVWSLQLSLSTLCGLFLILSGGLLFFPFDFFLLLLSEDSADDLEDLVYLFKVENNTNESRSFS